MVSFSVTVAVFVLVPAPFAVTVIETEAMPPLPNVPKLQETNDSAKKPQGEPWLGVAETKVRPGPTAGNVSVTVTPVELDGPLLVTVRV